MAIDMPPQQPATMVEYRTTAPAKPAAFVAQAVEHAKAARARAQAAMDRGVYGAMGALPDIDERSPHMKAADRRVLQTGPVAGASRDPGEGYVSMRLRTSAALDMDSDVIGYGAKLTAAQERARRCMVVRMVMDPRAGSYVVGGERAAKAARDMMPKAAIAECASSIRSQAATVAAGVTGGARSAAKGPTVADAGQAAAMMRSKAQGR